MVTDKTVITLKNGFKLDQLKNNYIFNVRVNNNTQNSTSDNKPKAKAIIVPIIGKQIPFKSFLMTGLLIHSFSVAGSLLSFMSRISGTIIFCLLKKSKDLLLIFRSL